MNTDVSNQLLQYMLAADRKAANALVDEWAGVHDGYGQAVNSLLEPALNAFGRLWATDDDVNLAQGYVSAKIAEDVMSKALAERPADAGPVRQKGPVIIGNIEDDYHALGRKMVGTFLQADGWEVVDLGNDVLPGEFVDRAVAAGAKVIGASAMMYVNAINIKNLRNEIDRRSLAGKIQLAVGGAIFVLRPELVAEVGGDGTAKNALAAPALMEQLWQKAEAMGRMK